MRTLEGCHDILAQITEEEQFEEVDFAFLSDKKLLNTAMSRAKNKIIVVGDASTMIFLGWWYFVRLLPSVLNEAIVFSIVLRN